MAAQAAVWGRCRLGLGTRHAGLELAHGEVLSGLGRHHRVLDVLEVVGLDRPVRPRAGGDAHARNIHLHGPPTDCLVRTRG